jgi:hypothetical protein
MEALVMSIETNIKITFEDRTFLIEDTIITAPVNLYAALAAVVNNVEGNNWKITFQPTAIEYFKGEEE